MEPKSLLNLSTEVLENVVSCIEYPKDLLHLSLAAKPFHRIIVPYHLELRYIRCDPRREDIWKKLIEKPILAANIRMLEIVYPFRTYCLPASSRSTDQVPRFFTIGEAPSTEEYNLDAFVKAIELMTFLVRFSWVGQMPQDSDLIFAAINKHSVPLRELQIGQTHGPYDQSLGIFLPQTRWPLKHLAHLTTLSITNSHDSRCYAQVYTALLTEPKLALRDVYLRLPDITFATKFQVKLFRLAHWPELRRLTIKGGGIVRVINFEKFINRHRNLEALSLDGPVASIIKAAQLPNLQSLKFSYDMQSPFTMPMEIAKGLKHFGVLVSDIKGVQVFQHMTSLKSAGLNWITNISKFVEMVPNLERLRYAQPKASKREIKNRIKHLSKLQKLTHLCDFFALTELSILSPRNEELLETLANSVPSLTYVEVMYQHPAWVVIERDSKDGLYTGYRDVDSEEERSLHPNAWGNYFTGFH